MSQFSYVTGFLFDEIGERVLLIWKKKPYWQAGYLNGIGGHIERGETPIQAMCREFKEETGIDIQGWHHYATLAGNNPQWAVHFFYAYSAVLNTVTNIAPVTDEIPFVGLVSNISQYRLIPNAVWLIPMALGMRNERAGSFLIEEVPSISTQHCISGNGD
ncbi:MAG: NUDIX hydrolase [Acidobacteriota bacterium]